MQEGSGGFINLDVVGIGVGHVYPPVPAGVHVSGIAEISGAATGSTDRVEQGSGRVIDANLICRSVAHVDPTLAVDVDSSGQNSRTGRKLSQV